MIVVILFHYVVVIRVLPHLIPMRLKMKTRDQFFMQIPQDWLFK
jgi:hypothetical protein